MLLKIYDVLANGDRKLIKTYCGTRGEGFQYTSEGNSLDIDFKTDGSGEKTGFSLKYVDTDKLITTLAPTSTRT